MASITILRVSKRREFRLFQLHGEPIFGKEINNHWSAVISTKLLYMEPLIDMLTLQARHRHSGKIWLQTLRFYSFDIWKKNKLSERIAALHAKRGHWHCEKESFYHRNFPNWLNTLPWATLFPSTSHLGVRVLCDFSVRMEKIHSFWIVFHIGV